MKKPPPPAEAPAGDALRRRAEERLEEARPGARAPSPPDLERLVHELQVHQVELELQNEELRRTRDELEASLARVTELYDLAPVGYLTLDARGAVREANLKGAALLGLERQALIGQALDLFLAAGSRAAFRAFLQAALTSDTRQTCDVALHRAGGEQPLVQLEGLGLGTGAGDVAGCRVAMVDVTALRRLEGQARQGAKMEAVALLAAGVAHEINNPLSYVLEGLHFLQQELASTSPGREDLQETLRDGCQGVMRIRDLVRSLRVLSGPEGTELAPVDPGEELATALRMASNELRHRASVVTDLGRVPRVMARPHSLGQVFLNLLVNAAQAIPEGDAGGNRVTIRSATDAGGWAVVEVADTGSGMTPEVRERIFEPFYTTRLRGQGTGLGLAVAHGIVAEVGGRIEVSTAPGAGSTFRVLLPPAAAAASHPAAPQPAAPEAVPRPPLRVLVVDDEPQVARSVARCLASGCTVTVAGSGEEALSLLEGGAAFEVVVCDLMMRGLSGQGLHERVAARWPEQARRFVFLTGGAFTAQARSFLAATSCPCMDKPFSPSELRALVRRVADGSRR